MNRSITTRVAKLEERLCPKRRRSFAPHFGQLLARACSEKLDKEAARQMDLMMVTLVGQPPGRDAAYSALLEMGKKPRGAFID